MQVYPKKIKKKLFLIVQNFEQCVRNDMNWALSLVNKFYYHHSMFKVVLDGFLL